MYYRRLRKLKSIRNYAVLVVLGVGVIVGSYLTFHPTDFLPSANEGAKHSPNDEETDKPGASGLSENKRVSSIKILGKRESTVSALLETDKDPTLGKEFEIQVVARSDRDEINLISLKLNYDPQYLEAVEVKKNSDEIKLWVDATIKKGEGQIVLAGGLPTPGYKSSIDNNGLEVARIKFKPLKLGNTQIGVDQSSQFYRNSDNEPILANRFGLELLVLEPNNSLLNDLNNDGIVNVFDRIVKNIKR